MRKIMIGLCLLLGLAGCSQEPQNLVKVALVCPLTGDVAAMGQGMKRGAEIAVAEANAAKKLGDRTIELAAFDDRADPKEAVNAANRIISDRRIVGVIGHLNSGCSIPAGQIYAKRKLAMISPASTNPKLTLQGLKNVFRVCATDDVQGTFAADYILDTLKLDRVAVIHDKTAYGQGLAESFKKRLESRRGTAVSFDGVDMGDKDFKALLTTLKTKNPKLIYFGGMYTEGGLIARQAKELGLAAPLFSGDGSYTPEFIKIGGGATEGDYATTMGASADKLPKAKAFIAAYQARYPGADMQAYDAYTYDAVNILLEAVAQAGPDPAKIVGRVAGIKYDGIIGQTRFDPNGDTLNKTISIYKVAGGKFVWVK